MRLIKTWKKVLLKHIMQQDCYYTLYRKLFHCYAGFNILPFASNENFE